MKILFGSSHVRTDRDAYSPRSGLTTRSEMTFSHFIQKAKEQSVPYGLSLAARLTECRLPQELFKIWCEVVSLQSERIDNLIFRATIATKLSDMKKMIQARC